MPVQLSPGEVRERIERRPDLQGSLAVTALAYLYKPLLPLLQRITIRRDSPRDARPGDILVPEGYAVDVVVTGLNEPVHCCFDETGACYVIECGHKIEADPPRVLKVDTATGRYEVFYQLPREKWIQTGAVTGACWYGDALYLANTDRLTRIDRDGTATDVLTGLPGRGDHQTNHPLVGADGKIYFGQGTVTNAGVVGPDNAAFEWLAKYPDACDVPAQDVTLVGRNFESADLLGSLTDRVRTGAYVPFNTETRAGQVIKGSNKPTGAILRCAPDGSGLETVAWGLRNPFGIAFHPDGRLFATDHGIDERGHRYNTGDLEDMYEITEGAWYGWPDFASGIRLDDPAWPSGKAREPLLERHPDPDPPRPCAIFEPHAAPNGFDFSRSDSFGFVGQAFVALFGDNAPVTARPIMPRGYKVVRVDVDTGQVFDFAVNKITGPASKLPHDGFERPSHCQFGPDGSLYIVDFGPLKVAPERGGVRAQAGTGILWRVRRTAEAAQGTMPPSPARFPHTGLVVTLAALLLAAAAVALAALLRR